MDAERACAGVKFDHNGHSAHVLSKDFHYSSASQAKLPLQASNPDCYDPQHWEEGKSDGMVIRSGYYEDDESHC